MDFYRKKPVVIDANQWWENGDHPDDGVGDTAADPLTGEPYIRLEGTVVRFFRHPDHPDAEPCGVCGKTYFHHGWIDTLEGGHRVCPGDWIITGVNGERYPCKPDIFAKTYEPIE
jgi:hypothetical protein